MRKTFFLIVTLLISYHAVAQNQKWEVIINSPSESAYATDIIECYDQGYFLGGFIAATGNGWNIKTNSNGSLLYNQLLSHNLSDLDNYAVTQDAEGNIYTTGPLFMNNFIDNWPFLLKFNPCGELLWCRYFKGWNNLVDGRTFDIVINDKNEIILLALFYSPPVKSTEIYLICINSDGEELWKKKYASKENYPLMVNPIGADLLLHNNQYFISGYCYYPYPNNPNHVFQRPLFIGIDSDFKEKFVIPFYAMDSVFGKAHKCIPVNDTLYMGVGIRRFYGGKDYSLLMFINKFGEELGYNQITNEQIGPEINNNYIHDIARINDSLFIAAAPFGNDLSLNPVGEIVIDTAGNLYNSQSRLGTVKKPKILKTRAENFVILTTMTQGNNSNIYLYKINADLESIPFDTTQYVYDSLCPHPISSGTIDLTDCLVITSIDELPTPDEYYESIRWIPLKAYPNPVSGQELTIEFENTQHHSNMELRLYDAFGKEIHRRNIYTGQQDTRLDVGHWPPGLYLAVIYSNGGAVGRCKVLVE